MCSRLALAARRSHQKFPNLNILRIASVRPSDTVVECLSSLSYIAHIAHISQSMVERQTL